MGVSFGEVIGDVQPDNLDATQRDEPVTQAQPAEIEPGALRRESARLRRRDARLRAT